jgi:hypothetical protein
MFAMRLGHHQGCVLPLLCLQAVIFVDDLNMPQVSLTLSLLLIRA